MSSAKISGLAVVALAYGVALAAAVAGTAVARGAGWLGPQPHPLLLVAVADVLGTIVIFAFSMAFRNSSFYDAYWSVAPIVIVGWLWSLPQADAGELARQAIVAGLVAVWGIRLTANWALGWTGLSHEDWRYVDLAQQTGRAWPLVSLLGVHLFPTVLVYGGCLALWPVMTGPAPLGLADVAAVGLTAAAIATEAVADIQLRAHRRTAAPADVLQTGLWAWSRHPNYLGEIGFWLGLFACGLASGAPALWTGVGVAAMLALFLGVSIPMIEQRMAAKRPAYADVQRRVSMLLPWPPTRS
ncbi:MAG: DUF1295 domain-containing protein [Myxococcales bacterium]|nr:DUF1295 domain-containing protein [Myxococcales bacterium]